MITAGDVIDGWMNDSEEFRKLRAKLVSNQSSNWLLALMGHAISKARNGSELSDLETILVQDLPVFGDDDTWTYIGDFYEKLTQELRDELFPQRFAMLTSDEMYSVDNLVAELPEIAAVIESESNHLISDDPTAVTAGGRVSDYTSSEIALEEAYGDVFVLDVAAPAPDNYDYGAGWNGSPSSGLGVSSAALTGAEPEQERRDDIRYRIKLNGFQCDVESSEWSSSDEVYFIYTSTVEGRLLPTRTTPTWNDVDAGEFFRLDAADGWFWHPDGFPDGSPLPSDMLGLHLEFWEHDDGNLAKILSTLADIIDKAVVPFLEAAKEQAWLAGMRGVGQLMMAASKALEDDMIGHFTLTYSRAELQARVQHVHMEAINIWGREVSPRTYGYMIPVRLADGDCSYLASIFISSPDAKRLAP